VAQKKLKIVYEPSTTTPRLDEKGNPITASLYPPSANPCPNCQAVCCTSRIETSIPDMIDFCLGLDLPFHTAFELAENGLKPFELDIGPRIFVLKRSADNYCRFLGRYDDEFRCGVYGLRPATCRLYPFTFNDGSQRIGPKMIRCPVPFGLSPEREIEMTATAKKALKDWALHDEIVKKWKRKRKRDLETFLRFCVESLAAARSQPKPKLKNLIMLSQTSSKERGLQALIDSGILRI
jgi:Fe-S-cluster containining protein